MSEITPTLASLQRHVYVMANDGISHLPEMGMTLDEMVAWSEEFTVDPHVNQPAYTTETLPEGLRRTVATIGRLLKANQIDINFDVKPPKNSQPEGSHIDVIFGSCVASLVVPVKGPTATFAYSSGERFMYPFEAPPEDVKKISYRLGEAILLRTAAFRLRESAQAPAETLQPLQHAGWNLEEARVLLFANYFATHPYQLDPDNERLLAA